MDSPAGQSAPGVSRQRRILPIVPVIPRKLEKKSTGNVAQLPIGSAVVGSETAPFRRGSSVAQGIRETPERRGSSVGMEASVTVLRRSSSIAIEFAEEIMEKPEGEEVEKNPTSGDVPEIRSRKQSKDEGEHLLLLEPPLTNQRYNLDRYYSERKERFHSGINGFYCQLCFRKSHKPIARSVDQQ